MSGFKQSFAGWCYNRSGIPMPELLRAAVEIGYQGIELVEPEYWPLIKEYGLTIASMNEGITIPKGLNRKENHAELEKKIQAAISLAAQWEIPNVIVFSGNRAGLDDREGAEMTAEGLYRVAGMAGEAGVTLVLELLNSKVDHHDYQCDRTAWGVEVCRMVDSPNVKLLYDIYHMQIMEGNIIQTIRDYHSYFGHFHTAGVPGRHELDDTQEINYPPVIRAIGETGYQGFIGHEFVPKGDPIAGLKQAFNLCNI
jgi:hydroxypyruvate isomerase